MDNNNSFSIDALVPQAMAQKMESVGLAKVNLGPLRMFALAVLAGAFIAMGAIFATTVTTGGSVLPYGVSKLLGGLVFSLGLILVVGAGAELFTGNNLIVMAWAHRRVSTGRLLRNWTIVYVGNFAGSLLTAAMMFLSEQYTFANGAIGLNALTIANNKTSLDFVPALVLGIFCNALVCLAVWLCIGARSATDKILAIIFPITAFVAAGFEHSVANMYFIPIGLFIKAGAGPDFWAQIGQTAADYTGLTWGNFLLANLLPVTIGNVIGGAGMVGLVYWFIYLRPSWTGQRREEPAEAQARVQQA
ncbi:MAG: formate transporter FocA [Chloroflexi bacterium]|nr:formate transporter FocA [Chloroflexota bacterium]MCI0577824.1 formate transporter FocA [Chloroflexota bacterium]MCI0646121.1 formate transporter FocA [Chloroflexota bacterium]MCI0731692.1 formate transporter FocA [Chloroflexota bacterium]